MTHEVDGDHNTLILAEVTPAIRVSWTKARAWHGEKVLIAVRTDLVKNGAKLTLEIYPKGNAVIDTLPNETIQDNKRDKEYSIEWKSKTLPEGVSEFLVKASLPEFQIEAESDSLWVDLVVPAFSA
jgi:hypothetical protein